MIGAIILLLVFYAILIGIYYGYKVFSVDKSACFGMSMECYEQDQKKKNNEAYDIALSDKCQEAIKPWAGAMLGLFLKKTCHPEDKGGVSGGSIEKCYEDLKLANPDMFGEDGTHGYITDYMIRHLRDPNNPATDERAELIKSYEHCNSVVEKKIKFKTSWLYFGDGF